MLTSAKVSDLPDQEAVVGLSKVEISADPRDGLGPLLRNVVRQPWFTSLSLFLADLFLVTGAYLISRTIRVNQEIIIRSEWRLPLRHPVCVHRRCPMCGKLYAACAGVSFCLIASGVNAWLLTPRRRESVVIRCV
jgi:drug/metabolite transporter superfamily protein YnfA